MKRNYRTVTEVFDFGPYVTKIILPMPAMVSSAAISPETFNVHVNRRDRNSGEVLMQRKDWFSEDYAPSRGYCPVADAYASDMDGNRADTGDYATLELVVGPTLRLNSQVLATTHNFFVFNDFRITQIKEICTEKDPVSGLVFDHFSGDRMDQVEGWVNLCSSWPERRLRYGYYAPRTGNGQRPLIIWLHGAGEGGQDIKAAYAANKVVSLSSEKIQQYFGGAYVLAPQVPTMWMDDGSGEYTQGGKSMYVKALKALIDEFVSLHADIDTRRIYIGGCSNGGFMTMRMIIDYPGFFAAAYPVCEALYDVTITDENISDIKSTPIWFTHAKNDPIVKPDVTSVPTYERLLRAGAGNIHFSYFDKVVDTSGRYLGEDGKPFEYFGHGTWHYMLNDECRLDYDGLPVKAGGREVTLLQWLALQTL